MSECRLRAVLGVRRVFWLAPDNGARLASPADGSGEAWRAGSGERAQEMGVLVVVLQSCA
jgi:hypothetical protein